ncbi:MAG: ATP-dependent dethiobiotin synthetase BioD 1 [Chloroflexi bacterium]|nr:ATP-dependent dethiobiotin synthetase BioD 1 [Chloroflexota bacterium]
MKKANGIFVLGTDTEIGKTVITGLLAGLLREQGIRIGVMKPVASGGIPTPEGIISEDAIFLKEAAGVEDNLRKINPYCLKNPMAPGVAARIEKVDVSFPVIAESYRYLQQRYDLTLVEGAGGLIVPLTPSFLTNIDEIKMLSIPVILVGRGTLGTINHICLTVRVLQQEGIEILGIILNRYQERGIVEETNPQVIEEITGIKIFGVIPQIDGISLNPPRLGRGIATLEDNLRPSWWKYLEEMLPSCTGPGS